MMKIFVIALSLWPALTTTHIFGEDSPVPTQNHRYAYIVVHTGPVRETSSTRLSAAVRGLRETLERRYAFVAEILENKTSVELWQLYQRVQRDADPMDDFLFFFFGFGEKDSETGQCRWIINTDGDQPIVIPEDVAQRLTYVLPARHVGLFATGCGPTRPSIVRLSENEQDRDPVDRFRDSFRGKSVEVIGAFPAEETPEELYSIVKTIDDWLSSAKAPKTLVDLVEQQRSESQLPIDWVHAFKESYGHHEGLLLLVPDTPFSIDDLDGAKRSSAETLKMRGALADGVRKLQEFLNNEECYVDVDGDWGPDTRKALSMCQYDLHQYVFLSQRGGRYQDRKFEGGPLSWLDFVSLFLEPALMQERQQLDYSLADFRLSPIGVEMQDNFEPGMNESSIFSEIAESEAARQFRERYSQGRTTLKPECVGCPWMEVIPPGDFVLGNTDDDGSTPGNNTPAVELGLSYLLAVSRTPITVEQWQQCVDEGSCDRNVANEDRKPQGAWPVVNVSWADAQDYLEWLHKQTGSVYRLLSEAEWEYVASAGSPTKFWWGNEPRPDLANFAADEGDAPSTPVAVNAFATAAERHPFRILDILGNTWEIVDDCRTDSYALLRQIFGERAYRRSVDSKRFGVEAWLQADGQRGPAFDCRSAMIRGGSWVDSWGRVTVRTRSSITVDQRFSNVGFRVAKDLPDDSRVPKLLKSLLGGWSSESTD